MENPYLEWTEDSIADEIFEVEQWMLEDWLDSHTTDNDKYIKYKQLQYARCKLWEKK